VPIPQETKVDIETLVKNLPEEVVELVVGQQDEIEDLRKKLEAHSAPEVEAPETTLAKALSALPPEVAQVISAQQERLATAEASLAQATEIINKGLTAQSDQQFIAKAASWTNIVDSPAELGPALRRIAEALPQDAAVIEKTLTAAHERASYGLLFKELGYGAEGTGESADRVDQIAKSLQANDPTLSPEAARSLAFEQNPGLYESYVAQRPIH
jgi:hypothetical protein